MDEARYQMQRNGWHPNPQWMITTEEIKEMWPFMKTDDVLGGVFNPGTFHFACNVSCIVFVLVLVIYININEHYRSFP